MERTNLTEEVYCLTNVHARTQLIECLIYNMCAHVDYENLLASLLGPTIYPIKFYHVSPQYLSDKMRDGLHDAHSKFPKFSIFHEIISH